MTANYYVMIIGSEGVGQAKGPFSLTEAQGCSLKVTQNISAKGWRVIEVTNDEGLLSFLCDKMYDIVSVEILPEDYYQPIVWKRAIDASDVASSFFDF